MTLLVTFLALMFFYSVISSRLDRTIITAPILFAAGPCLPGKRRWPQWRFTESSL